MPQPVSPKEDPAGTDVAGASPKGTDVPDVVGWLFGVELRGVTAQIGVSSSRIRAAMPIELAKQAAEVFGYDFTPEEIESLRIASYETRHGVSPETDQGDSDRKAAGS